MVSMSTPLVGSSSTSKSGLDINVIAKNTLCT